MSNYSEKSRPLRIEWVPAAYRDDKGKDGSSIADEKRDFIGFKKKPVTELKIRISQKQFKSKR